MRPPVHLIIWVLVAAELNSTGALHCNRDPEDVHSPKSVNTHFHLRIAGNPNKYVPGGVYTVSLYGQRDGWYQPTFKKFMLVVESSSNSLFSGEDSTFIDQKVGIFSLTGTNVAQFSSHCPNAIVQMSTSKRTEVSVIWTAPPPGSGCVVFRATIVEDHELWYKDDERLNLELCEDDQRSESDQPDLDFPCCACDDALYEMTFERLWSKATHPKEFPSNNWLTGFTDLIGASHSSDYRFWDYGKLASEGLKLVAESGETHVMESEIKDKSEHVRTIIKARGLIYPSVTGKTYSVFRVDAQDHLVSVVSRIDPSPDWIVGVSGLNLCLENCSWVDYREVNLYPLDAGTDSGIAYLSPDEPTEPRQTIRHITSSYPNDPRSPFYDPSGTKMQPLAHLYLRRQQLFEKQCDDTDDKPKSHDGSGAEPPSVDCAVSEWSEWSYCSVTCGMGKRERHRFYLDKKAHLRACNEVLKEEDLCYAAQKICSPSQKHRPQDSICAVTEWSPWSACSVSCGLGQKIRTRHYKSHRDYKRCSRCPNQPELEQTIECQAPENAMCDKDSEIEETEACPDTEWSVWSPCSVSCGKGKSIRKRIPVLKAGLEDDAVVACPEVHVIEEKDCIGDFPSCEITPKLYREFCKAPMEEGACDGQNFRWFFNADTDACQEFVYKGCNGNRNNYLTQEDCENTCKGYEGPDDEEEVAEEDAMMPSPYNGLLPSSHIVSLNTTAYGLMVSAIPNYNSEPETEPITIVEGEIVDCKVSRWSRWSKCSISCGQGYKTRSRSIEVHPRNGGKACPKKLFKNKKCRKKCGKWAQSTETN